MDTIKLESKWKMIEEESETGYSSIKISEDCIPDFFLSYDREKNRCVILSMPKRYRASFLTETREYISVHYYDDSNHIVVKLQEPRFNDVFNSFILSVYHRIKHTNIAETAVNELLKVYHEWSEFFAESSSQQLSFNDVMGMVGEIFVLNGLIRDTTAADINNLLGSWTGPYDRGHDFTFDAGDIEVKTKPLVSPQVRISSEFQLQAAFGKALTLFVVSVQTDGEGTRTLAEFILETRDLIIERLGEVSIFLKAIGRKGLTLMNASTYDQHHFVIKKTVSYDCNADGFPKFVPTNIPSETRDLKYNLIADSLTRYITAQNDY